MFQFFKKNGTNADGKISTENQRFEDPIRLSGDKPFSFWTS
jgi:hypothetical protein